MRSRKRTVLAGFAALPPVAVVLAGGARHLARRALPLIHGSEGVPGLCERVEVVRDGAGVPHVYAASLADLFFAQGYVTAQDRLWQMEFGRRTAWGRLAEALGPFALEADRFFRMLGLGRAALAETEQLDPAMRPLIQAYADGVNACANRHPLPLEYALLRLRFAPWQPADSAAVGKLMAWQLSTNASSELLRAALVGKVGPRGAAALMPSVPAGVVPQMDTALDYAGLGTSYLRRLDRLIGFVCPPADQLGSNNWVVAGWRTASGLPLLAGDPHLGVQMPSVWYVVHLVGGGMDVIGFSLPGTPGVMVGHNRRIAWGVTNTGADVQDLYVERRNPANPRQFLFKGVWENATVVQEEIRVRGRPDPVRLEIPYTRHGPVINAEAGDEAPLALRWVAYEPTQLLRSVVRLDLANNWQEFRAALCDFAVPAQNFVYADVAGNIGYQLPGLIPIRARGDGLLPVPGWTGEYEWTGYVPFDKLPSTLNPPEGYVVTANDRAVPDGYPHLITHEWGPSFRADRIRELLLAKDRLTADDMRAIQGDIRSLLAARIVPHVLAAGRLARAGRWGQPEPSALAALAQLEDWDCVTAADSAAATVFAVFHNRLLRRTFSAALGPELYRLYLGDSRSHTLALPALLDDAEGAWYGEGRATGGEGRDETIWHSLAEAADLLARHFGGDPRAWRWGRLHKTTFAHPLGRVPLLGRLLNRGPYPRGGDVATVNVSGYRFSSPYGEAHQPSFRLIADLADWDRSLGVITTGQSGQALSPHYDDQMELWLAGEYQTLLYERRLVEQNSEGRLELSPS